MKAQDVPDTLDLALAKSGLDHVNVGHRPRLLSDNGSSYISADLAKWLEDKRIEHIRGAPYHPQTQGKIERWHQTLKNRLLLNNYYLPRELEAEIAAFVENYNHCRLHEVSATSRRQTSILDEVSRSWRKGNGSKSSQSGLGACSIS